MVRAPYWPDPCFCQDEESALVILVEFLKTCTTRNIIILSEEDGAGLGVLIHALIKHNLFMDFRSANK